MGKNNSNQKIIGVIGGMGPQATVEFYKLLVDKSISKYGAVNNDEFPEILIDSVPVPDFISSIKYLSQARRILIDRVSRMNKYPVSILGIACNTAHILLPDLRKISKAPIVSVAEEIKKFINKNSFQKIGLMATIITYKMRLYDIINSDGVRLIIPQFQLQEQLERIIRGVIRGEDLATLKKDMEEISIQFIKENNLDAVILGCTELPLVFPNQQRIKVVSSLHILADVLIDHYYEGKNYD